MKLQVVVPSYNCPDYIGRCMDTIARQEYDNYDVIVIDDASTSVEQPNMITSFCSDRGWRSRINPINMGAGYNIYRAINEDLDCGFDDPILIIDGDDFLPHDHVFERIAELYQDLSLWMLWTQYMPFPENTGQTPSADYPSKITEARAYRDLGNILNHMVTFRYFLYRESLSPKDLQLEDGSWLKAGYDRMTFVPLLERAGWHARFVDEVLYCYNSVNPMSDVFVRLADAQEAARRVQRLAKKPPLPEEYVVEWRRLYAKEA